MRWWLLAATVILAKPAYAGDTVRSLAKSGDWAAIEHVSGAPATPHVCLAIDPTVEMALRADAGGTELLVGNRHWDLPEGVRGTIQISLGIDHRSFPITTNTNHIVFASIDPPALIALLDAMTKTDAMRVVVGEATPLKVSLAGSAVVLNAFRACAGIG